MFEVLAVIGGVGTVGALAAVITLALKLATSKDETANAQDMFARATIERLAMTTERDRLSTLSDTQSAAIAELTRRLVAAEEQRNAAAEDARAAVIAKIKSAKIADAVGIVNTLLSTPLGRKP